MLGGDAVTAVGVGDTGAVGDGRGSPSVGAHEAARIAIAATAPAAAESLFPAFTLVIVRRNAFVILLEIAVLGSRPRLNEGRLFVDRLFPFVINGEFLQPVIRND